VSLTSGESGSIAREGIAGTDLYVQAPHVECCNCTYCIETQPAVKWSDAWIDRQASGNALSTPLGRPRKPPDSTVPFFFDSSQRDSPAFSRTKLPPLANSLTP